MMKQHRRIIITGDEPWAITPELRFKLYLLYAVALSAIVAFVFTQCSP